jgi:hypothetical protein
MNAYEWALRLNVGKTAKPRKKIRNFYQGGEGRVGVRLDKRKIGRLKN